MGKVIFNLIFLTATLLSVGCANKKDGNDANDKKLIEVDKIVKEYIVKHRKIYDVKRPVYFSVNFNHTIDSLLIFTVSPSSRPIEERTEPFRYKVFKAGDFDNVAFYYSSQDTNSNEKIKKELLRKGLMLPIDIKGSLPVPDMDIFEHWEVWHAIMCLSDQSHYTIEKKHSVFLLEDIPEDFKCP